MQRQYLMWKGHGVNSQFHLMPFSGQDRIHLSQQKVLGKSDLWAVMWFMATSICDLEGRRLGQNKKTEACQPPRRPPCVSSPLTALPVRILTAVTSLLFFVNV